MADHPMRRSGLGALLSPACWTELLRLGGPRRYGPGEILMMQDTPGNCVLVLLRGRVKIILLESSGVELPIAVRYPGEVLGDITVLDESRRTATVVAIDPCQVLEVPGRRFQQFVTAQGLAPLIRRHSLARLREAEERRAELVTFPLPQRLCRALLRLVTKDASGPGGVVDLSMSQEEFGRMIGASRNAVGLVLARLRELGVADTVRQGVVIHDMAALRRYAEEGFSGGDPAG